MDSMRAPITAITFAVFAALALDVYSTLNSSPQTTELFASDRQDSLMHWVIIGDVVAVAVGLVWTIISGSPWPVIGTAAVAGGMHYAYTHAVQRGIDTPAPDGGSY